MAPALPRRLAASLRERISQPQHRDALYLTVNTGAMALAGLLFWLVVTRVLELPPSQVGHGYAIIALGTAIGVVAKGGLDTALVRHSHEAGSDDAARLLRLALAIGTTVAVVLALTLALVSRMDGVLPQLTPQGWTLAAGIAVLLLATWLQDARYVAEREARLTLSRNVAGSFVKVFVPLALVALAVPQPVAVAWAVALAVAALLGFALARRLPAREGRPVARRAFLATSGRNVASGAAEFLPGLLLAPLVLAIDGPQAAAHFGIAWTAASLLFLVSSALSRSALVSFVREPSVGHPAAVRRGIVQHLVLVLPAAAAGAILAPFVMGVFGASYAREGALAFAILCASVLVVAPASLYLAVLRARERVLPLVALPTATIIALLLLAPFLEARLGVAGVALAWAIANAPFGLWSAWRLSREAKEVKPDAAASHDRRPHVG